MAYRYVSTDPQTGVRTFVNESGDTFEFLDAEIEHLHLDLTGLDGATLDKVAPDVGALTRAATRK